MKQLLYLVIIPVVCYLLGAYITLEPNIFAWSEGGRYIHLMVSVAIAVVYRVILEEEKA